MSYSLDQNSSDYQHGSKGVEVFVGGLARTLNEDKVRKVFSACGEIIDMRLIKDQNGILKGFGFVRFATKEAADKALKELSGSMLEGKKIGVLPSAAQDTLFLGNLNKGWSADDFNKVVRQVFPDVVSIDLAMPQNGSDTSKKIKNRGFAFVKFSSHATAARAFRAGSKPDFVLGGTLHPSVQWAEEDPEVDPDELAKIKIAFVRKLPSNIDEDYLKKLFMPFGKVEKVVVSSKGDSSVGFVHFSQRSHLDNAIEGLNEKIVQGPKGGPSIKLQVEVARPMDKKRKRVYEDFQNTQPRDNSLNKPRPHNHDPYLNSFDGHEETLQKEAVVDPHEAAVLLLPVAVRERLLRILRLGIATRFDIEVESLANLAELPESMAISVLDQFMLSGAEKHDKGGYLASLISRYQVDKFGANQQPSTLSRLREPVRAHLPSVDSLTYVDPSRGDSYTSRYSTLYSDYRLPSRPGMVKTEDRSPIQLHELPGSSSSSSYGKYLVNSHIPTAYGNMEEMSPVQAHQIPSPSFAKPSQNPYNRIPGPTPTLPFSKSVPSPDPHINDRPGSRPQMRFDPFTGQPYKFDPFTGEPIVPESLSRRYDSPY